jgi:hypothetical protein
MFVVTGAILAITSLVRQPDQHASLR